MRFLLFAFTYLLSNQTPVNVPFQVITLNFQIKIKVVKLRSLRDRSTYTAVKTKWRERGVFSITWI